MAYGQNVPSCDPLNYQLYKENIHKQNKSTFPTVTHLKTLHDVRVRDYYYLFHNHYLPTEYTPKRGTIVRLNYAF